MQLGSSAAPDLRLSLGQGGLHRTSPASPEAYVRPVRFGPCRCTRSLARACCHAGGAPGPARAGSGKAAVVPADLHSRSRRSTLLPGVQVELLMTILGI